MPIGLSYDVTFICSCHGIFLLLIVLELNRITLKFPTISDSVRSDLDTFM